MSKEELWGNIGSEEVCCRFSIVCAQKLSSKMFLSMVGGLKNGRKRVLAGPKGLENLLEGKNGSKVENSMFLFKMVKKYC